MNFNPILTVFLGIFLFVWTCSNILSSGGGNLQLSNNSNRLESEVTIISDELAAEGLDLQLLPGILKQSKTAEEFEQKINEPNGVNNLDLNNDGEVDYLKVDEYGDREKLDYGFSISTEVAEGEVQEIATLEIKKEGEKVKVNTYGNQQIYGPGVGYSAFYGMGSFFMWSYLLSPHRYYTSPYYYGSYPSYYQRNSTVTRNDYLNRASRFEKTTSRYDGTSSGKSPNYNKTANSGIKRSLRNPTTSQKSFQSRLKNRTVKSGGFGRSGSSQSKLRNSRGGLGGFFGNRNRSVRGFSGFSRGFGGFGK